MLGMLAPIWLCLFLPHYPAEPMFSPVAEFSAGDGISLSMPWFVACNPHDGLIYVVDQREHQVVVLDGKLELVGTIGRFGQGPGEFNYPAGIAFDGDDRMYVCDVGNCRVQILDKNRGFVSYFKWRFDDYQPDICVDSKGRIFLNQPTLEDLIVVVNRNGEVVGSFGRKVPSKNPVRRKFCNYVRMAMDMDDNLFCVFLESPVLRKYRRDFQLEFEKRFDQVPEIKEATRLWREQKELRKNPRIHLFKQYFTGVSCRGSEVYIGLRSTKSNPIHVLDADGALLRRICLTGGEGNPLNVFRFDISVEGDVAVVDILQRGIYKFKEEGKQ
jgi:hypothetical protein